MIGVRTVNFLDGFDDSGNDTVPRRGCFVLLEGKSQAQLIISLETSYTASRL